MKRIHTRLYTQGILLGLILAILGCTRSERPVTIPVDHFVLEEGFGMECIASEPLIVDPVAMTFDAAGRVWVVEMRTYMPDIKGPGKKHRRAGS